MVISANGGILNMSRWNAGAHQLQSVAQRQVDMPFLITLGDGCHVEMLLLESIIDLLSDLEVLQ